MSEVPKQGPENTANQPPVANDAPPEFHPRPTVAGALGAMFLRDSYDAGNPITIYGPRPFVIQKGRPTRYLNVPDVTSAAEKLNPKPKE